MMTFLEKFIAAFILIVVMGLVAVVCSGIVVGVIVGWAWILQHLPGWGQWTFNIFAICTILALIMAAVDEAHES